MGVYHCFVPLHLSWEAKRLKLKANKEEWVSKTDSLNILISSIWNSFSKTLSGGGGEREYFDGSGTIVVNGEVRAQEVQFSLDDVEVVTATIDLEEVRTKRYEPSQGSKAVRAPVYRRIETSSQKAMK